MKRLFFVFFFQILLSINLYSQIWPKTYPQWNNTFTFWILEDYDKGFLYLLGPAGIYYIYSIIVKTDVNGNILWNKYIGNGSYHFTIGQFDKTNDNGIIYCAGYDKYDPVGASDPFLMKFNSCGDLDWCTVINTPGMFDYADRVRQISSGDYILLTNYYDSNWDAHLQLFKFDKNSQLLWKQEYLPNDVIVNQDGYDLLVLNDGYLISGICDSPDLGKSGNFYERPYYIRTDTAGNELWRLAYGRINGYTGFPSYCTLKNSSGNFYNTGWHSNYCDTPALIKCMSNGTEGYYKDLCPEACPGGNSEMNWLNDSSFVALVGGTVNGSMMVKWIKFDTLGNTKYSKIFTEPWIVKSGYSVVTYDNKIACLSNQNVNIYFYKLNSDFEYDSIYTRHFTYDSLCPHPIVSDTVDPECGLILSVNEPQDHPETAKLKVYPNPASNQLAIEFPKYIVTSTGTGKNLSNTVFYQWKSTILEVYDLSGKQMISQEIPKDQHQLVLDVSSWHRGMYYFRLSYRGQTVSGEKVVVE